MTGKGGCTEVWGAGLGVSWYSSGSVRTGGHVFILRRGQGREMTLAISPVFLARSSHDPCLSRACSKISKSLSLPSAPDVFQTAGSKLYFRGLFCLLSL